MNQTCPWETLKCGHCLEILRVAISEDYTPDAREGAEELLSQYDPHGRCHCLGGLGEEDQDKNTLTITTYQNTSRLTFKPNEDDDDPDDITLTLESWSYSGNNTIGVVYESCDLEFYVNRNSFLGIMARSILKVDFMLDGIVNVDALRLDSQDEEYDASDGDYTLVDLLFKYFSNDTVIEEAKNITVSAYDDTNRRRRRRLQNEDDDVAISVLIFTDSAEAARQAKRDLEASQRQQDGWDEEVMDVIRNRTGENPNIPAESIKYTLISPDDLKSQEPNIDQDPNEHEILTRLEIFLIVMAVIAVVALTVIIGIAVAYRKDKKKGEMEYQKPEETHDPIPDTNDTDGGACAEEGEDGEQEEILPAHAGLNGVGVSHKIIFRGDLDDSDDDDYQTGINRYGSHESDGSQGVKYQKSDFVSTDTVSQISSFSAKTSILNFDLESNLEIEELLPQMINKVCTSKKTRLIDDDDLKIEKIIGKGHYGEVYVGKYDGNTVAIKTFPDLDIHNVDSDPITNDDENDNSSLIGPLSGSLSAMKSLKKGGYSSLTKEDDDDDAKMFTIDNGLTEKQNAVLRKKIYSRKKEIYSEVVLASSLPLHPNLVQILGITQNPLKIVMSYYEGGNLKDFIYRDRREMKYDLITLNSIVILMQKIADGILFLHNNKIVHRDIAARNVLLGHIGRDGQITENTQVVLSDFGMTRCMKNDESIDSIYREKITKQRIGPIKWMAPESISKQKYSYKSDVYMFGITMFEIMHGKQPYTHLKYNNFTLPILATKIVKKSIRPIIDQQQELKGILLGNINIETTVIPEINRLIQICWEKSPQHRPTMLKILHTLNSIYDSMLGLG